MLSLLLRKMPLLRIAVNPRLLHHTSIVQSPRKPPPKSTPQASSPVKTSSSLTVSYLRTACSLSPASALSVLKALRVTTTKKPDAVLRTLAGYGVGQSHVASIVSRLPEVLTADPDRTLKPKLDFLQSAGFTGPVLADLLAANPRLLVSSLQKKIAPCIDFLKTILPSDLSAAAVSILKASTLLVTGDHLPNVHLLQKHGLSNHAVLKLLLTRPRALVLRLDRLESIVVKVKEMGLDPNNVMFIHAIGILSYMSESTLTRKVELYRSLGWSEDEFFMAFRKQPMCLCISDKEIKQKMEFFTKVLWWDTTFLSKSPSLLLYSVEKRFVPRCRVLNLLMFKGLIRRNTMGARRFLMGEKTFLEKYVRKYENRVPGVVEAYNDSKGFEGWEMGCPEEFC